MVRRLLLVAAAVALVGTPGGVTERFARPIESATHDLSLIMQRVDERDVEAAPRWIQGTTHRYLVNPDGAPEGAIEDIASAIDQWMATGIDLHFEYGGTSSRRGASSDDVNLISWVELPAEPFVARTTVYWYADRPEEIIGFDLVFNLAHRFERIDPREESTDAYDIGTVAAHEWGHVLGLGHADPERVLQIMRPRIRPGEIDHTPSLRDIDALAALYDVPTAGRADGFGWVWRGARQPAGPDRADADASETASDPGLFDAPG